MPGDILKAVPYLPDKFGVFLFKFFQILVIINGRFCDQSFHQTAKVDIKPDFTAFVLERPAFIVGYGLDLNQKYRNIDCIMEVIE